MSDETNIGNPLNARHDEETRNAPHVTPIPAQAEADDLFDDTVAAEEESLERTRPNCRTEGQSPRSPSDR
jgi:hypothetical protein